MASLSNNVTIKTADFMVAATYGTGALSNTLMYATSGEEWVEIHDMRVIGTLGVGTVDIKIANTSSGQILATYTTNILAPTLPFGSGLLRKNAILVPPGSTVYIDKGATGSSITIYTIGHRFVNTQ